MKYDLSQNDRFFLNQLIPKWETGKPFDLSGDMKYVFHREKGTNYNPAQFEYTLKTISAFLSDNGFAKEIPGKQYNFNLLPKGNSLMVKGTIEQFEFYQEQERSSGHTIAPPPRDATPPRSRQNIDFQGNDDYKSKSGSSFLRILILLGILAAIAWYVMRSQG